MTDPCQSSQARSLRRRCVARSWRRQQGFSLIEVLVAFTIFVMAMAVLLELFGSGLRAAESGGDYSRATLLAQSTLALLQTEGAPGEAAGTRTTEEGYRIEVRVEPWLEDTGPDAGTALPAFKVTVEGGWGDPPRARRVALESLLLGHPEPAS